MKAQRDGAKDGEERKALRVVIIGWGAIARRVAELVTERNEGSIRIVGVAVRDATRARNDLPPGARLITLPADLAGLNADLAIEAASADAVHSWGEAAISNGCDLVVTSTSAFCDDRILSHLCAEAAARGRQVVVPPGAIGMDILGAAAILGLDRVVHTISKPPAAWRGTAAEQALDLASLTQPQQFREGTARDIASQYPQNANAAAFVALAGIGLDRTMVRLVADPNSSRNRHTIEAEGAFGRVSLTIENSPLKTNPKSSEITALSLVRVLESRVATLLC